MNQLCRVCGEPAAGFHFGAFTCEGCKSFFGRTYNNVSSLGDCKNGGRCVINKKNRTSCKACRLRKCLVVGMSKSGSRYGRRSNWFKIHCLLQEKAASLTIAMERNNNSLAVQEAKRALQGLTSVTTSPPPEANAKSSEASEETHISIKEEDSGPESPALSSPESQASDNSLESTLDPRRPPPPFHLYPKLGVLSPFFLHTASPLTSPSSPYPRLPFYPYLYPVLSRPAERPHTTATSVATHSPTHSYIPSPAHVHPESPPSSHPLIFPSVREPAHSHITNHPKPSSTPTHNPPTHHPPPPTTHNNEPAKKLTIVEDLPRSRQEKERSLSPEARGPSTPRCGDEAEEQEEPIDLSVRRPPSPTSHACSKAPTTTETHVTYSMKVTTASISPGCGQEASTAPVDLSCRA